MVRITEQDLGHLDDAADRIRTRQSAARAAERRGRVARRNLLKGAAVGGLSLGVVAGVAKGFSELATAAYVAREREKNKPLFDAAIRRYLDGQEGYRYEGEIPISPDANHRKSPYGFRRFPKGENVYRGIQQEARIHKFLVVRGENVSPDNAPNADLWAFYRDDLGKPVFISLFGLKEDFGIDVDFSRLTSGRINLSGEEGLTLTTPGNQLLQIELDPR